MKTLIIYHSQTGFTAKYAQWMAEATGADRVELKEAKKKDLKFFDSYDKIIYGGWPWGRRGARACGSRPVGGLWC